MNKVNCWKCSNPECHCNSFKGHLTTLEYCTFDPVEWDLETYDSETVEGFTSAICTLCGSDAEFVPMDMEEYESFFGIELPDYYKKQQGAVKPSKAPVSTELVYNNPFEIEL